MSSNIALFGAGRHGEHYLQRCFGTYGMDLSNKIGGIHVIEVNEQRREYIARAFPDAIIHASEQEFWSQAETIDAAFLAVSPGEHARIGADLLTRDIPTLIEKPSALSSVRAHELADIQATSGTPAVCAYQMAFERPYVKARAALEGLDPTFLDIRWIKNRGKRDHLIGSILLEDTHAFGYVYQLLGMPDEIRTLSARPMHMKVDPQKWAIGASHAEEIGARKVGEHEFRGKRYSTVEAIGDAHVWLSYADGRHAHVWLSYETGMRENSLHIEGRKPGKRLQDPDWYSQFFSLKACVDSMRPKGDLRRVPEITPYLRVIGANEGDVASGRDAATRTGYGRVLQDKTYAPTDVLGEMIDTFLDSLAEEEMHPQLTTLRDAAYIQEIAERAHQSAVARP